MIPGPVHNKMQRPRTTGALPIKRHAVNELLTFPAPRVVREARVRRDRVTIRPGPSEDPGVLVIGGTTGRETPNEGDRVADGAVCAPSATETEACIPTSGAGTAGARTRTHRITTGVFLTGRGPRTVEGTGAGRVLSTKAFHAVTTP